MDQGASADVSKEHSVTARRLSWYPDKEMLIKSISPEVQSESEEPKCQENLLHRAGGAGGHGGTRKDGGEQGETVI